MALGPITNLASAEAADAERKRRQEQAALADQDAAFKDELLGLKDTEATSPARLLELKNVHLDDATRRDAEQHAFLDQQARTRLDRRENTLGQRMHASSVPGLSAEERATQMAAPLGRFATEDPTMRASELRTDPRGREHELEALKSQLVEDPSHERGGGADRFYYREEPTGTLAFTNRPEVAAQPGYRRYNSDSGATKDLGALGGGLTTMRTPGGPMDHRDALLQSLDELTTEAKRQPLTPQETAGALVQNEPVWDAKAADLGPVGTHDALNQAVAEGSLDPKVATYLQKKYLGIANDVDQGDGPDPRDFADRLRQGRPPLPGEAEARAQAPSPIPEAQAQEQRAVRGALEAPQDGPGATRSPALSAEQAAAGGPAPDDIARPRGQSMTVPGVGGEAGYEMNAPFIPERMRSIPEQFGEARDVARYAAPAPGGEGTADLDAFAGLPEELRLVLEGASRAAGGHEHAAERQRRLAREAARRRG